MYRAKNDDDDATFQGEQYCTLSSFLACIGRIKYTLSPGNSSAC